jgi:hypothetical protein
MPTQKERVVAKERCTTESSCRWRVQLAQLKLYLISNLKFPSNQHPQYKLQFKIHYNFQNSKHKPNVNYPLSFYALQYESLGLLLVSHFAVIK